ncbi:MAG: sigma-54-dependent Fis family transcriptional regulator [Candidatus Tectomicrobia bacterium]|uniref:Sigma-54-dependent Fis family transcriptional regulator n=1 Tax=Tectimicrobiota bacterium TaxID=2528274 RepID=A0A932CL80_UNCTE|nr:sigma-54-dependent Fis family transcriptional regulator [Candidatus Tectomicrobia bacterium]
MATRILVVDDEAGMRKSLAIMLRREGYAVVEAAGGHDAVEQLGRDIFHLVITDLRMGDMSGIDLLRHVKQTGARVEVILMTAFGTVESAVDAMRLGAFDVITKPFQLEEILLRVHNALEKHRLNEEVDLLRAEVKNAFGVEGVVGASEAMRQVLGMIPKIAPTDSTVLITGESGTGKELVARAIYQHSNRAGQPFVAVNCAAIPKELLESELFGYERGAFTGAVAPRIGKFEEADGGTLFLDEIGDMDLTMQSKLLRVLQEKSFRRLGGTADRHIDVRLLAATNQDLEVLIEKGLFRGDLFYRLNVVAINLPSLRERREDIPILVEHFLRKFQRELGSKVGQISPEALGYLMEYEWRGNVRELENVIKRAVVLTTTDTILPEQLPCSVTRLPLEPSPRKLSLEELLEEKLKPCVSELGRLGEGNLYPLVTKAVEKVLFQLVLQVTKGNQVKAATLLGINRNTLRKKVTELGLDPKGIREKGEN